jgi:hypothetical protein
MRARASILVMLALAAGLVHGCAEGGARACAAGDYRYCDCPTISRGYALCADDGSGYGACDCSGKIPTGAGVLVEAGAPDAAADASSTSKGFLEPCSVDAECSTKLCFAFNAYGPHCSQPCAKDVDCPPPSPGCSNKNVCKLH